MAVRDASAMWNIRRTTVAWTAASVRVNTASVASSVNSALTGELDYCNAVLPIPAANYH